MQIANFVACWIHRVTEVGRRPGGSDGVGDGHAGGKPAMGEVVDDSVGQRGLAAKKGLQAGDVQKEAIRGGGVVEADQRTESPAPDGQPFQRLPIGGRIVRFQVQRRGAGQRGRFGRGHAGPGPQGFGLRGARGHPAAAAMGFIQDDRLPVKLRPPGADPLERPVV